MIFFECSSKSIEIINCNFSIYKEKFRTFLPQIFRKRESPEEAVEHDWTDRHLKVLVESVTALTLFSAKLFH